MRHPRKKKSNQRPKVVIEYPPVPTKKWIPPEKRKKPPKPEPAYVKPEGISQKLAISTLKKVWNKFELYGDAGIITGSFSQYHKRFNFKSNGFQGACNSAVACVYAYLYKMATWSRYLLDDILIRGDELYIRSTQQGDKCLIEVPPEQVHHSFFLGNQKITIFVSPNNKLTETVAQRKAIESLENFIEKFLSKHDSGIFYTDEKYTAIWLRDGVYYFFDPGEHDEYGDPWTGIPGFGVSFLGRFKKLSTLAEYLYRNFPSVKGTQSQVKFYVIPCGVARIVKIKTKPPETFDEVAPQDVGFTKIIEENIPPPPNVKQQSLFQYVHEEVKEPLTIQIQEISPGVHDDLPASKRPSFLHEGPINKSDICRYQVPVPTYLKGEQAKLSYYTELIPEQVGILRGSTCQTNPNFSKYLGRQSMGNALSALIMLRFTKAKHWVPRIVDGILQNGERIYRDAMLNIPRSHSLRLSNFPKKIEYENRKFTPEIDEYALVGQLQSQDYEILDLGPALDEFLTDNDCCIILGPQILAVWMEDGIYYMFDPNERDPHGRAIDKTPIVGSNVVNLEPPSGVACVLWFQNLNDLVNWYLSNTERDKKHDRFYLSKVMVNDYVEIPEKWSKFIGICLGKWILRGTFSQASVRFSPESRNSQGTANAFISLAMQTLLDVSEWSSDIVDEILTTGDGFYKLSVEQLQKKGAFTSPYLMLSELNPIAKLRDKEAHFELEECIVNGLVNAKNANDLSDVQKGLEVFFNENDYGILTTREISLSIWHKGEAYYYLDPYSRDEKGLAAVYGTSCVLRLLQLEDLARCIEGNLDPNTDDFFNITKLIVTLYDTSDGGVVKPFLNNYTSVNDRSAILRSWLSNENEKYEIRKGRQTVPMCLSGLSFNKLKPALEWTRNDMDIILDKGDDHYMQSIGKVQKELDEQGPPTKSPDVDTEHHLDPQAGGDAKPTPPPPPTVKSERQEGEADEEELNVITSEQEEEEEEEEEEQPEVELKITSENVIPEFKIGPNNIALEFVELAQGNIRESLKNSLAVFYEEEQTDENFNQEALLETENYTVAMWRDDKVYYVFDPKPRDKNGEVIGKEDWDPEPPMPKHEAEIDEDVDVEGGGDEGDETDEQLKLDEVPEPPVDDDEDEKAENEAEGKVGDALAPADLNIIEAEEEMEEEQKEQEEQEEQEGQEEQEEQVPSKPKKSPSYWLEQEKSGRACTRWFLNLNDMINFVYGNIPVRDRLKKDFVLKSVNAVNHLQTKHKFRPDDERDNVYSGDWYDFKELDYGVWIMRGTLNLTHELFPEKNRGKQTLTASVMALGIAVTFEMTCFSATVPDTIMVYGDKLYTFMKKHRKKQLLKDPNTNLKPDEIDWLVQHEEFHITDIPKKICVSKFLMEIDVEPNFVTGDVKAQNFEDILDVKRGLDKFFESNKYGVLFAKEPSTSSAPSTQYCDVCQLEVPASRGKGHARTLQHREKSCVVQEEGVQLIRTSFRSRLATYRIQGQGEELNINGFMEKIKEKTINLLQANIRKYVNVKIGMELFGRFLLQAKETTEVKSFNSRFQMVSGDTDLEELFTQFREILDKKATEFEEKESGWTLQQLLHIEVAINRFNPLKASSYIPLPKEIERKKAVLNIQNTDEKCFTWSVLAALHPVDRAQTPRRVTHYQAFENELDFTGINNSPMKLIDVPKFEELNGISINVYGLEKVFENGKNTIEVVGPLHFTKSRKKNRHVNLLLISDDYENNHYCLIRNMSRLVSRQINNTQKTMYLCNGCLIHFYSEEKLKAHQANDCKHVSVKLPTTDLHKDKFGLYVAVWKGERIYYMFDGLKRGPGGIQSTIGTGCITRFLDTKKLANIFLQNLPVPGKSEFVIHKVFVSRDLCPREREAKEVITPPKAVPPSVGLKVVVPGKRIISGTMSQEDPRFGKGPNVLSAPIAIIALTMSIVHKPETWSKPIVDEIVLLGLELYEDSVNELGFDFNPWEDKLDIYRVKKDFKIGVIKANCELRNTDQRGLIDVKDGNVQNLRQGMESFFNENTHGILVTDLLTLAVWEQQEEDNSVIYIFDPNPRSSTGMPLFTGTACVLSFANAKMASDHITGCILDPKKREEEYIIVPVEIVVGSTKTMQKEPKKSPTRSSISVLPRCSSMVAAEQKKKLRKLAEEERKRKEAKKQQMIGRNGYHLKGSQAILRGYKSQKSDAYSPESRDNQDIPHCIVSVVMNFLLPIEDWNYNHIDLILDTGDQLYIDSYIAYGPKNPKLGMENVLRKFFMGNLEVHITVYKPVITEVFTPSKLNTVLEAFFQQETVCILNYNNQWISLFFKGGYYFVFDPHERDIEGNIVKPDKAGTAVVIRFDNLKAMTLKVVHNLGGNTDDAETFSLWLISIETKQ